MKTILLGIAGIVLLTLTGCQLAGLVPSLEACDEVRYTRLGKLSSPDGMNADLSVRKCRG